MKKIILILSLFIVFMFGFSSFTYAERIGQSTLNKLSDSNRIGEKLEATNIKDFIINIATKALMPIMIFIGLLFAFNGFYKLAFSDKEDDRKQGTNFALWGTTGVVIMVSAYFIVTNLVGEGGGGGIIGVGGGQEDPAGIAGALYGGIIKKFFVLIMYFVVSILFVILVINLIRFLASGDKEDVKKHSKTIVVRNSIGIILILFARNIVEMFFGKFQSNAQTLGDGQAILENKDLSWLTTILNYVLGFTAFLITGFIIYQSFLLLTKPDDESTYKSLKRYFVYALLGVLLIGGVYIIANFFIVQ